MPSVDLTKLEYSPLVERVKLSNIDGNIGEYYGKFKIQTVNETQKKLKTYRYHRYNLDYQPVYLWDAYFMGAVTQYFWDEHDVEEVTTALPRERKMGLADNSTEKFYSASNEFTAVSRATHSNQYYNNMRFIFYFSNVGARTNVNLTNCSMYAWSPSFFNKSTFYTYYRYADFGDTMKNYHHMIDPTKYTTQFDPFNALCFCYNDGAQPHWRTSAFTTPAYIYMPSHSNASSGTNAVSQKAIFSTLNVDKYKDCGGAGNMYLYEDCGNLPYLLTAHPQATQYNSPVNTNYVPLAWFWQEKDGSIWGKKDGSFFHPNYMHFSFLHEKDYRVIKVARRNVAPTEANYMSSIIDYEYYYFDKDSYTDGVNLYNVYPVTYSHFLEGSSNAQSSSTQVTEYLPVAWTTGTAPTGSTTLRSATVGLKLVEPHSDGLYRILDTSELFESFSFNLDDTTKLKTSAGTYYTWARLTGSDPSYSARPITPPGAFTESQYSSLVYYCNTTEKAWAEENIHNKYFLPNWTAEYFDSGNMDLIYSDEFIYYSGQLHLCDFTPDSELWTYLQTKKVYDESVEWTWPYYVCPTVEVHPYDEQLYKTTYEPKEESRQVSSFDENEYKAGFNKDNTLYYDNPQTATIQEGSRKYLGSFINGVGHEADGSKQSSYTTADGQFLYVCAGQSYDDFIAGDYMGECVTFGSPIGNVDKVGEGGAYLGKYYYLAEVNDYWDGCLYDDSITGVKLKSQIGTGKLEFGQFINSELSISLKQLPKLILDYLQENNYITFESYCIGSDYYLITDCKIGSDKTAHITAVSSLETMQNDSIDNIIDVCRTFPWHLSKSGYTFSYSDPAPAPSDPSWAIYWLINNNFMTSYKPTVSDYAESDMYKYFAPKFGAKFYIDLEKNGNGNLSPLYALTTTSLDNQSIRKWITNISKANLVFAKPMIEHREYAFFDFHQPIGHGLIDSSKILQSDISKVGYELRYIDMASDDKDGFFVDGETPDRKYNKIHYIGHPFMFDEEHDPALKYRRELFEEDTPKAGIHWKLGLKGSYITPPNDLGLDNTASLYSRFYTGSVKMADIPVTENGYIEPGDTIVITNTKYKDEYGNELSEDVVLVVTSIETDFRTTILKCEIDTKVESTAKSSGMTIE